MPFLSYIYATLLIFSGAATATLWTVQTSTQASLQEVSAASIRVMAGIVRSFIAEHPGIDGEISTTQLAPYTPSWFRGDARIRVVNKGGRGYIFIVPESGNRTATDTVIAGGEMPVTLGIAMGGRLISPLAGTVLLNIPDSIPNGSLVYVI